MTKNKINNSSLNLLVTNISINGSTISSLSNLDINLTPNGIGKVNISGAYSLPNTLGSVGTMLKSNGAGALTFGLPTSFSILNVQTFSVSGTYTPTVGLINAYIEVIGGGSGGGGKVTTSGISMTGGDGGYSGSYSAGLFSAASIGASKVVTIGAGGTGGVGATQPTAGGDSSVGSLITAKGGALAHNGDPVINGAFLITPDFDPKVGSGGTLNIFTSAPSFGIGISNVVSLGAGKGGLGGSSFYGGGGRAFCVPAGSSAAGQNGSGLGAGGSGAIGINSNASENGGNGANGFVIITEYIA